MKNAIYSAAAVLTLAAAPVAHAQSTDHGFTGPFVGVQGGWEENSVRNPSNAITTTPLTRSGDTGTLGVIMGYDKEVAPRIVVGGQAELNFPVDSRFGNGLASITPKRSVDVSLRAGYLVTPKTLVYAAVVTATGSMARMWARSTPPPIVTAGCWAAVSSAS